MLAEPDKKMVLLRHSFLLSLLIALALSISLLAPCAEAKQAIQNGPSYDPDNEGMIEKGSRVSKRHQCCSTLLSVFEPGY